MAKTIKIGDRYIRYTYTLQLYAFVRVLKLCHFCHKITLIEKK